MFTGIVEETGRVEAFKSARDAWRLVIAAEVVLGNTRLGDSIAVNGCCLTVAELEAGRLHFDVLEETRRLTNFASLGTGAPVNLERSLSFGGKVGGHFVTGHIDTTGTVAILEARGKDHYLRVRVPSGPMRYVVPKGSIAIDGISLTVAEVAAEEFAVWLIPHTMAATNLRARRPGEPVNLEFDLLAKHVEKLLAGRPA
ncbi:MAG TPA: riboflavin synthase [Candidatus Limnocylindria bacterium]|jgi:riboflavin synthase|nr:riboflavin synthase [Candidatus Limnocylindria bacterium]HTL68221.1 riboflavin synthase [Lacunisphaera sp.]